jgi:hypothetical protein
MAHFEVVLQHFPVVTGENYEQLNNTRNYWVFGLCPSSHIFKKTDNTTFRKLDLFPSLVEEEG